MKNNKLIIASILLMSVLVGCSNTSSTTSSENSNTVSTSVKDDSNDFTTYVKYPNGDPVTGVQVQYCSLNGFCLQPVSVDENGYVNMNGKTNDDTTYTVHVNSIPANYAHDPYGYKADKNNKHTIITLSKIEKNIKTGDVLTAGVYSVTFNADSLDSYVYFGVSMNANDKYQFTSWVDYTQLPDDDPSITVLGNDVNNLTEGNSDKDSGTESNFQLTYTSTNAETVYFGIKNTVADTMNFAIEKL